MPPTWVTALWVGVLIGVLVWLWQMACAQDERERKHRRNTLDDHERRLRVAEDLLIRLFGYEPSEDDE